MKSRHMKRLAVFLMVALVSSLFAGCGSGGGGISIAPPPPNSVVFTKDLKSVLLDVADESKRLGSMQLDMLFNPAASLDATRSSDMKIHIDLTNPTKPGEKMVLQTESIQNNSTGEASFTVAGGQGTEQVKGGGVYFVGGNMILKRGSAEKKMVRYALNPEQKTAYKTLSPMERLARTISGNPSGSKDSEQWTKAVDDFTANILKTAVETNYTAGEEKVTVLSAEQSCKAVVLKLEGDKAKTVISGMATLLQQNTSMGGVFDGSGSSKDAKGLQKFQDSLNKLTPEEVTALKLTFATTKFGDKALNFKIQAATGTKTFEMSEMHYKKGFERHNTIYMKNLDGSSIAFVDKNVSAGGDNYTGEITMVGKKADGSDDGSSKMNSTSTETDSKFSAQYTYNIVSSNSVNGTEKLQTTTGKLNWAQSKNGANEINGTGNGELTVPGADPGSNKLMMAITLDQKYGDVPVTAPQFIEGAGISATDRDSLLKATEIDKAEFDKQSLSEQMARGFGLMIY